MSSFGDLQSNPYLWEMYNTIGTRHRKVVAPFVATNMLMVTFVVGVQYGLMCLGIARQGAFGVHQSVPIDAHG